VGRINSISRNSLFGVESGVVVVVSGGDDEAAWVCILALSVWGCDGGLPLGRWHVSVACVHHACECECVYGAAFVRVLGAAVGVVGCVDGCCMHAQPWMMEMGYGDVRWRWSRRFRVVV
jgi:hypothetical protein